MSDERDGGQPRSAEELEAFYEGGLEAFGVIDEKSKVDSEVRRRRRFRAWFFVLLMVVAFAMFLVGAWIVSGATDPVGDVDPTTPIGATGEPADAVDLGGCTVPADAWDWEVDVTEETTDRGTRTVGEFRFSNQSSEGLRIWWLRSATSGDGDVSEDWQGGAPMAPGESESAFVSHAVLSDGTESWVVPTHVLAVRDDEACLAAAAAAIEGRSGDDVLVEATPLDLPFGPGTGR